MTIPLSIEDVRTKLAAGIVELNACATGPDADDTVLAWTNHLGVTFVQGKARAIDIVKADALDPRGLHALPKVRNGAGEMAMPQKRGDVARSQATTLQGLLDKGFESVK